MRKFIDLWELKQECKPIEEREEAQRKVNNYRFLADLFRGSSQGEIFAARQKEERKKLKGGQDDSNMSSL